MNTRKALRMGVFVVGCAASALALGGCASTPGGEQAQGARIPHAINKTLTKGYSPSEALSLNARDRKIYEAERHEDVYHYPEH
jgi:hypothetical protein